MSVVVPCRNEVDTIESCLHSLLQQQTPPGGWELLVADGMSDDGTRDILERMAKADPRVRMVDNPLRITPCGMNQGIRAARGQWIAILGAHNRYAPDYLVRCLEVAQATGADNVGGAMLCEGKGLVQRAIAAAHHSPFSTGGARWHNPAYEGPVDTVFGGFYKREVFERIGLFDQELVRNQDDEFNLRLTRAGGTIWQSPAIQSCYQPRRSFAALFRQYTQYGYWKVRVIQKHRLPASWRHLVPAAFLLLLSMLILVSGLGLAMERFGAWPVMLSRGPSWALLLLLGTYLVGLLSASILTGRKHGGLLVFLLPIVLACYHFGYGYGFLRGVWDFWVRQRTPGRKFNALTRTVLRPENVRR